MSADARQDSVSPQLREAEKQIDSVYLSNPLMTRPFAEAAWYFLAFCEERAFKPFMSSMDAEEACDIFAQAAMADEIVNHTKWPMRWLYKSCPAGGRVPCPYDPAMYQASWDLSVLGSKYINFESAFTYATLGLVELRQEGQRIIPSGMLVRDRRFEAYDRLADCEDKNSEPSIASVIDFVSDSVHVNGQRFSYPLNPRTVKEAAALLEPELSERFKLPGDWAVAVYSLGEYAQAAKCLWVISALHFGARLIAASRGCLGLGYTQALVLMSRDELERRLVRYSGLKESTARAIISDLTYGSGGLQASDPALQPLVEFQPSLLGWAPGLLMNMALERNMTVLLNRLPDTRRVYTGLSQEKEALLRKRITDGVRNLRLRFWNGTVAWREPLDIDLAIISDEARCCLLLELKSFIGPAEPREIRDRSEEIAIGIDQVKTRKRAFHQHPERMLEALTISEDYECTWAVVSETSVGGGWVQDDAVPVVRAGHFIRKFRELEALPRLANWLRLHEHLPVEGRDFSIVATDVKIERWQLAWYGIKGLVDG